VAKWRVVGFYTDEKGRVRPVTRRIGPRAARRTMNSFLIRRRSQLKPSLAEKANRILREGLKPGYTPSEQEAMIAQAERELGISRDDPDFWDQVGDWMDTREARARERFNEAMRRMRPDKELPTHEGAVFFWADPEYAQYVKRQMEEKSGEPYVVLKVDTKKAPGKFYVADKDIAEEAFDQALELEPDEYSPGFTSEEEEWAAEERLENLAKKYYSTMKPYTPEMKSSEVEVLTNKPIPPSAITLEEPPRQTEKQAAGQGVATWGG